MLGLAGFWAWRQTQVDPALFASGPNLLATEASPYLQLHAHNPVDWYRWGEAAFARARADDKPIFLSVGYSTCFWCHVMEREVFSDPAIAALMNEHFVSIKVDREERPDVDDVYVSATQLLTGSGGWPNSVFLTPDARPFFAGTYFPPTDRGGRRGFPSVLAGIRDAWSGDRAKIEDVANRVAKQIGHLVDRPEPAEAGAVPPADVTLQAALDSLAASYEPEHGGFSARIKFPRAPTLELLLVSLERNPDP